MARIRRGFSLVEVLVVVAIVALLASLLMPSLAQVKETARQAACSTHLGQIGMTVRAYALDHRGALPPVKWEVSSTVTTNWMSLSAEYADAAINPGSAPAWGGVSRTSIFKGCPSYTPPASDPQLGYGMNVFLDYPASARCNSPRLDGSPFYGTAGVTTFRLPALTYPSSRLLLAEVSGELRVWGGSSCSYRHRGKRLTSVLFCDGRIQPLPLPAATLAWGNPALLL